MKRKINKLAMFLMALATCTLFVACNNDEDENLPRRKSSKESVLFEQKTSTKDIAYKLLKAITDNPAIISEIYNGIEECMTYGLDENLTFYDVMHTDESKLISKSTFPYLQVAFTESDLNKLGFNSSNYYDDLNIYWGYHDNWDGKTTPIICYVDENTTVNYTGAFAVENNTIVNVTVTADEFDSEDKPIIIVNFNDYKYEAYPNFIEGEISKDNVIWTINSEISNKDTVNEKPNRWTDPNTLYKPYVSTFKSGGKQWDPWIKGGSEFKLSVAHLVDTVTTQIISQRISFTRKEIKKKKEKIISMLLHSDWQSDSVQFVFALIEEDFGWQDNFKVDVDITNYGKIYINFPKFYFDDEIGRSTEISRVSYITSIVNNDPYYDIDDCRIRTIIKTYEKVY